MQRMIATFGAGCFWGVEEAFRKLPGVIHTEVGYAGGNCKNPSYHQVCTGNTGHAEVVRIEYDPEKISYQKLLIVFWNSHDPTSDYQQEPDAGLQYRSVIFYHDEDQKREAEASKKEQGILRKDPILTEIVPIKDYFIAEEYHQKYIQKRNEN